MLELVSQTPPFSMEARMNPLKGILIVDHKFSLLLLTVAYFS
ncbi:hypothetical protein AM1_0567 [Acaryochloris marina MBIC11017]|uniref:Uncharacterized protein n=1 Tax=Acaryochloris marina (strain MBIC 11017) TaxID=329726 RepID=B0CD26_ACAM1|nr:hypothetical protein AM1_0567 [Acaryochloris marina MBIC11017]